MNEIDGIELVKRLHSAPLEQFNIFVVLPIATVKQQLFTRKVGCFCSVLTVSLLTYFQLT